MKAKISFLIIGLSLLVGVNRDFAQNAQYFRIAGPTVASVTAFNPDGTLVWSNALPGTNYIIQTCTTLSSGTNWVDYVQIPVTNGINTNLIFILKPPTGMAFIPAGSFRMGEVLTDFQPVAIPTNVYVSAFYIDKNPVTYSQWQVVYNWATNNGYTFANPGAGKATNHPVQLVNWFDCVKWSNARSQLAGLTPVYYADGAFTQVFTNGNSDVIVVYPNWTANGFRLPTEAEWEKAARGGLIGHRYPWGDTISESEANYNANPGGYYYDLGPYGGNNTNFNAGGETNLPFTSPIGYFAPNGYGLYDMSGNVYEWCWDWWSSPYIGGTDPHGLPFSSNGQRVMRGGSWADYANLASCSYRSSLIPVNTYGRIGFRCVIRY